MKSDIVIHASVRDTIGCRGFIAPALKAVEVYLKVPKDATVELAVSFIGPAKMRALNKKWRRMDTPTDVLSFPLRTPPIRGYTSVVLGDLFICPAIVRVKAEASGRSAREQMQWTIVHGLLHLAGYDHELSVAAARRMSALERRVLGRLGVL